MRKLNNKGIGHFLALALLVVGFSTYGSYQLVAQRSLLNRTQAKSALNVTHGVRMNGQTGAYSKTLQVKSGDMVEVSTTIRNDSEDIIFNLTYKNSLPKGLVAEGGSLAVNGQPIRSLLKNTNLNTLSPSATKTVTFRAMVVTSANACGTKKLNNTTVISAKSVRAQTFKISLDVCPGGSLVAANTTPDLTCSVNLVSRIRSGAKVVPSVTVKSGFDDKKVVNIDGTIGTDSKGGGFSGSLEMNPNSTRTYRSDSFLTAGSKGSTVTVTATASTADGSSVKCEKSASVR